MLPVALQVERGPIFLFRFLLIRFVDYAVERLRQRRERSRGRSGLLLFAGSPQYLIRARSVRLEQDQMLPLPRRGKGVGLPRFRRDGLRGQGTTVRTAWAHRYDVPSWRQVTVVGLTLCDGTHSRTIYCHSEDLFGSKFGASLDDQMGHRGRRPCGCRLAS